MSGHTHTDQVPRTGSRGSRTVSRGRAITARPPLLLAALLAALVSTLLTSLALAAANPVPATAGPGTFPLRVMPGARYLVDAAGKPFFVHGDSPWLLITELTREQVDLYLETRQRQGFNTLLVELTESANSTRAPANIYGEPPFLVPGNFATPNDAYFDHAEWVVRRAADAGMLVLLTPAYMGYEGRANEGFYPQMVASGREALAAYGRYVARRFAGHPNVLWVHGGDYNPPEMELLRAVAGPLYGAAEPWLHTYHGAPETIARERIDPRADPWLSVNVVYAYEDSLPVRLADAWRGSAMPFFMIESRYEGEQRRTTTEVTVRRQAYQAVLGGAFGHVYGNRPVWLFDPGWEAALDSPGARSMVQLRGLVDTLPWWRLVPDHDHRLLVAGRGERRMSAAAARTDDRATALVYLPDIRNVTVDLGQLRGPRIRARWWDPSAGTWLPAQRGPVPATGERVFNPGRKNRDGRDDWILVLDSIP